ncbi:CD226 antigen [Aplochiton taeniatus]
MEAVQKDHWYFLVLLSLLPSLKVAVLQRDVSTTVRLEEGMVLKCLCPWDGNLSMVSWTKIPETSPVAVFHPDFGVAFSYHYRERIEFLRTTPMDGSISIRNITHRDEGVYRCSVQTFPQGSWSMDILVQDSAEPDFLPTTEVPPEVMEADTELVAEKSDNLTLHCHHEHNGTVYQVSMEKLAHGRAGSGGGRAIILGTCRVVDGGLVAEEHTQRGRVNCSDTLDVSLQLVDVVEEDSGLYRCRFSTDAGVQTTTVLLTVPSPGERAAVAGGPRWLWK